MTDTDKHPSPGRVLKRAWARAGRPGSLKAFARALFRGDEIRVNGVSDPGVVAHEWWSSKLASSGSAAHLAARLRKRFGRKVGGRWVFDRKPSKSRRGLKGRSN